MGSERMEFGNLRGDLEVCQAEIKSPGWDQGVASKKYPAF
jgi:hypothetical protein